MADDASKLAASNLLGAGEYGATQVSVMADGSLTRIVFGRTGPKGFPVFHLGVLLSREAAIALRDHLVEHTR